MEAMISLEAVKDHAYITDKLQDAMLPVYIGSGIEWFEDYTHRAVTEQQWRMNLLGFPNNSDAVPDAILLPFGRCRSIDGITYTDTAGNTQALSGPSSSPAGADWQEDLDSDQGGLVAPTVNGAWPDVQDHTLKAVQITFTVGYKPSELPERVRNAILFQVATNYELRSAEDSKSDNLVAAERLARPYLLRGHG